VKRTTDDTQNRALARAQAPNTYAFRGEATEGAPYGRRSHTTPATTPIYLEALNLWLKSGLPDDEVEQLYEDRRRLSLAVYYFM
jgi:hypothetical protein